MRGLLWLGDGDLQGAEAMNQTMTTSCAKPRAISSAFSSLFQHSAFFQGHFSSMARVAAEAIFSSPANASAKRNEKRNA